MRLLGYSLTMSLIEEQFIFSQVIQKNRAPSVMNEARTDMKSYYLVKTIPSSLYHSLPNTAQLLLKYQLLPRNSTTAKSLIVIDRQAISTTATHYPAGFSLTDSNEPLPFKCPTKYSTHHLLFSQLLHTPTSRNKEC